MRIKIFELPFSGPYADHGKYLNDAEFGRGISAIYRFAELAQCKCWHVHFAHPFWRFKPEDSELSWVPEELLTAAERGRWQTFEFVDVPEERLRTWVYGLIKANILFFFQTSHLFSFHWAAPEHLSIVVPLIENSEGRLISELSGIDSFTDVTELATRSDFHDYTIYVPDTSEDIKNLN